ncbi:MAG: hypothetical protein C3F08_00655 [Candidatus Methylomirabilota bacterium]|nr:MAG: hypothetical protein C3F08_00655 [candidate division NC10 bacterium]
MAKLQYLADIHISPLTVEALRVAGYTIQRIAHVLSPRARDSEIVALARLEGWVILTQDLDFSALVAKSGDTRPSVVSLRLDNASPARVTQLLLSVLPDLGNELTRGAIVSVDEGGIRIRMLPVT